MKRLVTLVLFVCLLIASSSAASNPIPNQTNAVPGTQIPLSFEPNRGQTASQVRYLGRSREGIVFFTDQGMTIAVPGHGSFRLQFAEATASANFLPETLLAGRSNYLSTNASPSITNIESYASLLERGVYPGIDVRFYGNAQHLEHDLVVAPGADVNAFALLLDGVSNLRLDAAGNALFQLGELTFHESAPVAWQTIAGTRVLVKAEWKQMGSERLGLKVGNYDHTQTLIVDPVLAYSSYLGGSSGYDKSTPSSFPATTNITAMVVDSGQNVYVAGWTSAVDFPTTSGAYQRTPNYVSDFHADTTSVTGFVSKFSANGVLIYSTYLHSQISALAVDSNGEAYTAKGGSDSYNGPGSGYDNGVFVDKLSTDGSKLLYFYAFGQTPTNAPPSCTNVSGDSYPAGIQADKAGHVWIGGSTANPCLITTSGAYQTTMKGYYSGFVAELDSSKTGSSSIVHSTYLGGSGGDSISGYVLDSLSDSYVTGFARSADFPHTAVFGSDAANVAFVAKLNSTLSALTFSTWLEGVHDQDVSPSIAIDPSLNVYVAGQTNSSGYPITPNAYRRAIVSDGCSYGDSTVCTDGFVTALNSTGSSLIYSTFLGGKHTDAIRSIAVNNKSIAFVTGYTTSTDFPATSSAFKKSLGSEAYTNAFVTAINANGQSLYYSTLLGGTQNTSGYAIALDPAWNAYVVGSTGDSDFPTDGNAYQPTLKGSGDGFISKVVIAGDVKMTMTANTYTVAKNGYVTFYTQVTNLGPDGSDNVVMQDPIPSGWAYAGIYTTTASSCTTPTAGATSGTVVCKETRLESGKSFWVNVYLQAIGSSGSSLTNTVSAYAQTQDLNQSNNKVQVVVKVQ